MKPILELAMACLLAMTAWTDGMGDDAKRMVTLGTVKTRAVSMGGAFTSVRDDLAALDFNPAAFTLDPYGGDAGIFVFLNPLGPWLAVKNRRLYSDPSVPIGLCLRGLGFSAGRIDAGVLLGEESLHGDWNLDRRDPFDATGYETERNVDFGLSFALTQRAALGVSGEMLLRRPDWRKAKLGYRYGLIVQPRTNFTVGLFYADFPEGFNRDRADLESLADETLNVGVSYKPWTFALLSFDIRNVSDEEQSSVREPHMGVELVPFRHLALRGGYARTTDGKQETFSCGV
ncbi:MAG TPA: hypothetical protein VGB38_02355, partial [bacterium]